MTRVERLISEKRQLEAMLARTVLETLEACMEGRIPAEQAARIFLKLYVEGPPEPLEDILATLILVDEEPEYGAPTREELEAIATRLRALVEM